MCSCSFVFIYDMTFTMKIYEAYCALKSTPPVFVLHGFLLGWVLNLVQFSGRTCRLASS